MFIQTEETPNPNTIKFLPGQAVLGGNKTAHLTKSDNLKVSPIAEKLFDIKGIEAVFLGADFISVTKTDAKDWFVLKPQVLSTILDGLTMGVGFWDENEAQKAQGDNNQSSEENSSEDDDEIVTQIKELLETRVRPAVAQDGGDIVFHDFKEGVVYLEMRGACSGCPSSTATLKVGIENMLKYYVPEVEEVRPVI